ncbi:DEAD/DEAH box helicase family protein [Phenylobacterium sp. RIFCSPHIGHO2_01_FULL_69_31]|uniref:DEAD/DEAH box helicase family protein n=1 Tax=Phenylobacterium sp. RIFCSPHIGHO2_01_FULL_69_31 TaxID=1801944 RepID=UPI000AF7CAB0|nr:DEAD/DEAH box helicase family protein [Phenylobacterium sp. RIFCSPHIGHO2_01_FULL_69_31]
MTPPVPDLKAHYRSRRSSSLANDFFAPCLKVATAYRRAAGYFSSMALVTWAEALPRLVGERSLTIQLIACPELSRADIAVLRETIDDGKRAAYREMLVERMLEEVIAFADDPGDTGLRARILAWLLANDRLEIRFAFAGHVDEPGIFHEKIGVFDFPDGSKVAFTGSANETLGGHKRNYESIDVYRSWVAGDADRVAIKAEQFDEAWRGEAEGLEVSRPSQALIARLKAKAPERLPKPKPLPRPDGAEDPRWRHQTEAVTKFLEARAGVLEMATGTGKTRTTLKILERLIDEGQIQGAIVSMDGTDLLDQWSQELDAWMLKSDRRWLIYRHFERHRELGKFALDPERAILVISRGQLSKVLDRLPAPQRKSMIIVHDEVHGLGVPSLVATLKGEHPKFGWRLGLSATPDRAYDDAGNDFLREEIGDTLFRFPLEEAIRRGVLSGFDYVPLEYELTDGDRERLKAVYSREARRKAEGSPMSKEEVWTELSKVYKTAEQKPDVFRAFLKSRPDIMKNTIIFVETKEYGNALLETFHDYTTRYRTYYAEDDRDHLVQFARGEIDCLITCHRISQGIDIQALENVVLFASARAKLETIQRIGRCLRADPSNPDKRARVIDFVRPASPGDRFPNADQERCAWLTELSKVRREADA